MIWIIVIVIIGVIIYAISKNNSTNSSQTSYNKENVNAANIVDSSNFTNYWTHLKNQMPQKAFAIESLTGRDLSKLSDKDAFEIAQSIERWSNIAGKPISQLKESFLSELKPVIDELGLEAMIERTKQERDKEAKTFNISRDNTICAIMLESLIKMKTNNELQPVQDGGAMPPEGAPVEAPMEEDELREKALNALNSIIPSNKRGEMNKDVAWLMAVLQVAAMAVENQNDEAAMAVCYAFIELAQGGRNRIIGCSSADEDEFTEKALNALNSIIPSDKRGEFLQVVAMAVENQDPEAAMAVCHAFIDLAQGGRNRIIGCSSADEDEFTEKALALYSITPSNKRGEMNKDVAWLMADLIISMIKNGKIYDRFPFPTDVRQGLDNLISEIKNSSMSSSTIEDILDDVQQDFINSFGD